MGRAVSKSRWLDRYQLRAIEGGRYSTQSAVCCMFTVSNHVKYLPTCPFTAGSTFRRKSYHQLRYEKSHRAPSKRCLTVDALSLVLHLRGGNIISHPLGNTTSIAKRIPHDCHSDTYHTYVYMKVRDRSRSDVDHGH